MAHENKILELISLTLRCEEKPNGQEVLGELYQIVDEYNQFVKTMDRKLDKLVGKVEELVEDGH